MKLDLRTPHARRIREITLYIRAARVHHLAKMRSSIERRGAAESMRQWRDDAWFSWRKLAEKFSMERARTPWSLYSIRTQLRRGVE